MPAPQAKASLPSAFLPAAVRGLHRANASLALAACLCALFITACSTSDSEPGTTAAEDEGSTAESTAAQAEEDPTYPTTITDAIGRDVELASEPQRIASMAPSITETLFAVDAQDRVVGVTTADDYPPEVEEIEEVGDYREPNVEKLLDLEVDLLFLSFDSATAEEAQSLEEQTGAEVVVVNPESIEETVESVGLLAQAVGEPENGEEVQESMSRELSEIDETLGSAERQTVFYELYSDGPLQTVGPGSFVHDAIERAGGENVAANGGESYPTYSREILLEDDPDHYFVGRSSGISAAEIAKRPGYQALSAVREGQVTVVDDDLLYRPGPRIVEGVREIAEAMHPGVFEEEGAEQ